MQVAIVSEVYTVLSKPIHSHISVQAFILALYTVVTFTETVRRSYQAMAASPSPTSPKVNVKGGY